MTMAAEKIVEIDPRFPESIQPGTCASGPCALRMPPNCAASCLSLVATVHEQDHGLPGGNAGFPSVPALNVAMPG